MGSSDTTTPAEAAPPPEPPPLPPELGPAQAAFERGDFRTMNRLLAELLAAQPSPELQAAARAMLARTAIDPWAFRVALIAAALLAVITGAYVF
jgi:hypothetical protein